MSGARTEGPERIEIWVDSAGHGADEVAAMLRAVLATGIAPGRIRLVVDALAHEDTSEIVEAAEAAGVDRLSAAPDELNAALDSLGCDYLMIVRWGRMAPSAVPTIVGFLDRHAGFDLAYGDSVSTHGHPMLRPMASPIRLLSSDYLGPVVTVRADALQAIGGFRDEARRAQVLDIALRLGECGRQLALVPSVLATEDIAPGDFAGTEVAQRRVVEAALERRGVRGEVERVDTFVRRIKYVIDGDPLVSIVIPTRGSGAEIAGGERVLVVEAVRGIVERSSYPNVEFVVVADAETPDSVIEELEALCGDRLRLVLWDRPFNFSAKMNRGAAVARGEYLLLLNDDVEIVTDDWIETMLGLAQQDGVGIVGAQLYFEDSTIQHAGQIYTGGVAGHAAFEWAGGRDDSIKSLITDREVSGVTAACALIARELFFELGGFTLELPGNYNDVDLNMKVRATGRSAVVSPWARLYHFESKTRDPKILESDLATLQGRWKRRMQVELYSRML